MYGNHHFKIRELEKKDTGLMIVSTSRVCEILPYVISVFSIHVSYRGTKMQVDLPKKKNPRYLTL